mmetsp:Transcript_20779/g.45074  ORF Transcript_20779/g.45074 Transcript_20779/m.45074 type:complete len:93 (-) Transcript_20779:107-385(-)
MNQLIPISTRKSYMATSMVADNTKEATEANHRRGLGKSESKSSMCNVDNRSSSPLPTETDIMATSMVTGASMLNTTIKPKVDLRFSGNIQQN